MSIIEQWIHIHIKSKTRILFRALGNERQKREKPLPIQYLNLSVNASSTIHPNSLVSPSLKCQNILSNALKKRHKLQSVFFSLFHKEHILIFHNLFPCKKWQTKNETKLPFWNMSFLEHVLDLYVQLTDPIQSSECKNQGLDSYIVQTHQNQPSITIHFLH